jgi:c-di-GMP-binding flagellar brake protein YcgR
VGVVPTQVDERRRQGRLTLHLPAKRARRWTAGAWHDLEATVVDLSSRGVGLRVNQKVRIGDRLSLNVELADGGPDLRLTVEVRHARADSRSEEWHVGGLFKAIAPEDHQRVVRYIFDQLTSPSRL